MNVCLRLKLIIVLQPAKNIACNTIHKKNRCTASQNSDLKKLFHQENMNDPKYGAKKTYLSFFTLFSFQMKQKKSYFSLFFVAKQESKSRTCQYLLSLLLALSPYRNNPFQTWILHSCFRTIAGSQDQGLDPLFVFHKVDSLVQSLGAKKKKKLRHIFA